MLTWSHILRANVLKQAHAHELDHRKEMRIQLWLIWRNQNQANQGCNVLMMHINSHLVDLGTMQRMKHQAMTILLNKLQSERRPWKKMGTRTTIVWPMQWTLWKLVWKFKVQAMSRVCMSPHYETICVELLKLKREAT